MSIIVYGPQGSGKSRHAEALRKHFKLSRVIEADENLQDLDKRLHTKGGPAAIKRLNALILTSDMQLAGAEQIRRRILSIDEAKRQAGIPTQEA